MKDLMITMMMMVVVRRLSLLVFHSLLLIVIVVMAGDVVWVRSVWMQDHQGFASDVALPLNLLLPRLHLHLSLVLLLSLTRVGARHTLVPDEVAVVVVIVVVDSCGWGSRSLVWVCD